MAASLRPMALQKVLAAPMQRSAIKTAFRQSRSPLLIQKATFQSTPARAILPALPQVVKGGVNDAAPVPHPHPTHGSYHWSFERALSVALVPATMIPFAAGVGSPLVDSVLIGGTILHSYIGFQAAITDYLPTWRVPFTRKAFEWANFLAIFVVGYGFYEFETNDVGLTEAIKKVWTA